MTLPLKLSANLGFLWPEAPLLARIEHAGQAGFHGIEMHWPYDVPAQEVARQCREWNLEVLSINTPQGNVAQGDSGLAAQPGRESEFRAAFELTLDWARNSGARMIHVLPGRRCDDMQSATASFVENLRWASDLAQPHGIVLLLEAINGRDKPGYFYHTQEASDAIRHACARGNVKLMFDVYHVGVAQGDILKRLDRFLEHIAHVQVAGVPDRDEPDLGEVRYEVVFQHLVRRRYQGWIGCEYRARDDTVAGLNRWIKACGLSLK